MDMRMLRKDFAGRAVPGILALMLNSVYVVVDGLFVARLIGRDALAAVTVAVPLVEILIALAMLVSVGAGVLISKRQGQGDAMGARQAFNVSFVMMLGFSLLIMAAGLALHRPIARLAGATDDILPMVAEYLRYLFGFSPFLMFSFGLGSWARNDGKHRLALVAMGIGAVVNIVLDYVFIAWLGWGVEGAALATGLGPVVSCAVLLPHFLRRRGALYFERTRIRLAEVRAILFSGIPSFLMEFALGLTTFCVNLAAARHMGALGLAAYGVIGYAALIAMTVYLGMAEGTQPLFSFYHGRGMSGAVAYLLRLSLWVCVFSGIGFYGLILIGGRVPAMIFGGQDEVLIALALAGMRLYFPALFAAGMNIQFASALQSVGRWQRSAVVSALRALVLLSALLAVLPVALGNAGVWLASPLAELLTLPAAWWLWRTAAGERNATATAAAPIC